MHRRSFLSLPAAAAALEAQAPSPRDFHADGPLVIERKRDGKPRAGQVVAAIQPHSDDLPIFATGLWAKLADEGCTSYLIRVTNDDSAGPGRVPETVLANDRDNQALAELMGAKATFDLNYPNHNMDNTSRAELKARFIYLFRLLKVDIIISYDPSSHYEENPDHYVTAQCVEASCWMAGGDKDYPEHFYAGLKPQAVQEKYYFARFQQRINRIVDIEPWLDRKIDANLLNLAQGPAGNAGVRLKRRLAAEGRRLPLLDGDDRTANRNYIRQFVLERDRNLGAAHGLQYAEAYHHILPGPHPVDDFVRRNAQPI
ncbi:MAG: PIG-L family deacetylase [Bryobacter sp.]|jgi:LmbE family N-acetylglucosaminyl deacetylase|nr:PIG-L family deacetylase [Bryobacter sp. CoA8 C33]